MRNFFSNKTDDSIFYRFQNKKLENSLRENHTRIREQIAIPSGRSQAQMIPCKPEPNCNDESYIQEIEVLYHNELRQAEVELQVNIQPDFIDSENMLADDELVELVEKKKRVKNEHRIKSGELDGCDNTPLKKDRRYRLLIRPLLFIVVMLDMALSGSALESAGISKLMAYGFGFVLGCGIFFLSTYLPEIINKGRTLMEKRIIGGSLFTLCFFIFFALGKQRVVGYTGTSLEGSEGIKPIYFACMNTFVMFIAVITAYFTKPNKWERDVIDKYGVKKNEVNALDVELDRLGKRIKEVKTLKAQNELTRKQVAHYAMYIRNLIQGYMEESIRLYQSTNRMYRIDGKVPKFFKKAIKQLPVINVELKNPIQ